MTFRNPAFPAWLAGPVAEDGNYRHRRLEEVDGVRGEGLAALVAAVNAAHADAKRRLRDLAGASLDPFGEPDVPAEYPDGLHTITLQGYLGEAFAAVLAESFNPHDFEWDVPAVLFRFHEVAITGLDRRLQLGDEASRVPGRTGDDCIAFHRDESGKIDAWLNCEAKCSSDHSASLISVGHEQLSRPLVRAASGLQLIDVLRDSQRVDKDEWIAAIRVYRNESRGPEAAVRADMFVYVCGRSPAAGGSWLPEDAPHPSYAATHPLEAIEVHLGNFDEVLTTAYPAHTVNRD